MAFFRRGSYALCFIIEKKAEVYQRSNLRVPSKHLVHQWGKQLKMDSADVENISQRLRLRHTQGKYTGIPNSNVYMMWKIK